MKHKHNGSADIRAMYRDVASDAPAPKRKRKKSKSAMPVFRRPIICPPDGAGKSLKIRVVGYIARALVILLAVFGFTFFLTETFRFHYTVETVDRRGQTVLADAFVTDTVFLAALLSVAILSLICIFIDRRRVRTVLISVLSVGAAALGVGFAAFASLRAFCQTIVAALVNCILERLHGVRYLTLIPLWEYADRTMSEEFRVRAAAALLTLLIALLFVPFLIRKVRIAVPATVSAVILVFVFTCNISHSNWAFSIMIAAFASLIVMGAYDGLYRKRSHKGMYDETAVLFPESDRPALPKEAEERKAEREKQKQDRKDEQDRIRAERRQKRRKKREAPASSVGEELSDYYFAESNLKKQRVRLTPEERRAEKRERANIRRKARNAQSAVRRAARAETKKTDRIIRDGIDQVHEYDRRTEDSRAAAGGFAAVASFSLLMLVLIFPAISVEGEFKTIPAIDEHLQYYREYFTALLVGNEDVLDALDYEKTGDLDPHSTILQNRYYNGSDVLYVRTHAASNVYFPSWIATDFYDDHWYSVSKEQLQQYRELYELQDFPAEQVKTDFYRYFLSDEIPDPLDERIDWTTDFGYEPRYGVVLEEISVRRLSNVLDSKVLLPSAYISKYGMREYQDTEESDLSFINYFDGILTGRDFRENAEASHSTLAYVTTMQNPNFMKNLSAAIEAYNVNKTLCRLFDQGYFTNLEVNPNIDRLHNATGRGYSAFYEPLGVNVISYYDKVGVYQSRTIILMDRTLDVSLFEAYITTMTKEEQEEIRTIFRTYDTYRDYVYDAYLSTAVHTEDDGTRTESAVLSELSDLLAQEYLPYLSEEKGDGVLAQEAYLARHNFILSIIAYMKETCTYIERDPETLDIVFDLENLPTDPSLDSIENFLTVTREGYCVQYASALCLLLREQGIPARYVEGYVLNDQTRDRSLRNVIYNGYVKDYNAHAWVEVWYDGIGWIQYEPTPGEYYGDMYPEEEKPPEQDPDHNEEEDTEDPPVEEEPDYDTEHDPGMTEEERQALEEAERRAELRRRILLILMLSGIVLLLLIAMLWIVIAAHRKEKKREKLIKRVREHQYKPEERRETALLLIDHVTELLLLYRLAPMQGEQREAYAQRLLETMPSVFGFVPMIEGDDNVTPAMFRYEMDACAIFLSIAAEEFGKGMTDAEMRELAEFYARLRTQKKRFVSPLRRFVLHYFRRKL